MLIDDEARPVGSVRIGRRALVVGLGGGVAALAGKALAADARNVVPPMDRLVARSYELPTVKGPINGPGPAFGSANASRSYYREMLRHSGFVEHEYFVSGRADAVATAGSGALTDLPYTTRILVRRPANMSSWSGRAYVDTNSYALGIR